MKLSLKNKGNLISKKIKKDIYVISFIVLIPSCFLLLHYLVNIFGVAHLEKQILVVINLVFFMFITIKILHDCKKEISEKEDKKIKNT